MPEWYESDPVVSAAPAQTANWWDADPVASSVADAKQIAGPLPPREAGDASAAVGRGIINGIPIAGPYLLGGVNRLAAGVRALQNDTKFSDELQGVQDFGTKTAAEHPIAEGAGELAGGVIGTAPLVAAAPAAFGASAAALPVRAATSMLTNAALGGADAGVRSDGDFGAIGRGALVGGIVGGAAPVAGMAMGKAAEAVASRIKPAEAAPTLQELKDGARAAYQRADDAGVQIANPAFAAAVDDMSQAAKAAGIDRTIHPKATAALGRLEEAANGKAGFHGAPDAPPIAPTLKDVEILRRIVKGVGGPMEPDERRIASMLVDKLDDFTANLKAGDLVSGDAKTATDALTEARGLWGRAKKAEQIETAKTYAEDRAGSTGSGGNSENAIRQNIRAILDNPRKSAGFTPNEMHAMREIVRGTPVQNALRLVGKLSPAGNGLMAALGLGATVANPLLAAAPVAGMAAKKISDGAAARGAQRLSEMVRAGGQLPVSPLALPARETAERLLPFGFAGLPAYANQRLR
jgi:hypothetical protein